MARSTTNNCWKSICFHLFPRGLLIEQPIKFVHFLPCLSGFFIAYLKKVLLTKSNRPNGLKFFSEVTEKRPRCLPLFSKVADLSRHGKVSDLNPSVISVCINLYYI